MECLPDADTVGNEDEMGSTCLKLMWMDGVGGDEELRLLEAAAGEMSRAEAGGRPPKACYTCDQIRGRGGGTGAAVPAARPLSPL